MELTESGLAHLRDIRRRREQVLRRTLDRMPLDAQLALAAGLRALSDAAGESAEAPLRRETA